MEEGWELGEEKEIVKVNSGVVLGKADEARVDGSDGVKSAAACDVESFFIRTAKGTVRDFIRGDRQEGNQPFAHFQIRVDDIDATFDICIGFKG